MHAGTDSPSRVIKVPDVAIPMQHGLLKRISAFQSKEVGLGACLSVGWTWLLPGSSSLPAPSTDSALTD